MSLDAARASAEGGNMLVRSFVGFLITIHAVAGTAQPTITRFEQNDPRITYTGTWYPDTNSLESGGSAVLANLKGSQAIVVFNGTGITWIGESDGYSGLCYLTLDGVQTTVDTGSTSGCDSLSADTLPGSQFDSRSAQDGN